MRAQFHLRFLIAAAVPAACLWNPLPLDAAANAEPAGEPAGEAAVNAAELPEDPDPGIDAATLFPESAPALQFPDERIWTFLPRLTTGVFHESNIYLQASRPVGDWIASVSPGLSFELGAAGAGRNFFSNVPEASEEPGSLWLDSELSRLEFQQNRSQSVWNGAVQFGAVWGTARTRFGLRTGWDSVAERTADLGQRISPTGIRLRRETAAGVLRGVYELTAKTAVSADVFGLRESREPGFELDETRLSLGVSYAATEKIRASMQLAGGRVRLVAGPEQVYGQTTLVVRYEATPKTSLQAQAGLERRRIGDGGGSFLNPLLSLEAVWAPSENLRVRAALERQTATSRIFPTENFVRNTAELGVEWDLPWNMKTRAICGVGTADYTDSIRGRREESFFYGRVTVVRSVGRGIELELGFEQQANRSSTPGAGYRDSIGFFQIRLSP
ncbi:MAG: hypothetical protein RLZZ253_985 [Verrucomicrobiota bacterium]